jgi:hypothetical protein
MRESFIILSVRINICYNYSIYNKFQATVRSPLQFTTHNSQLIIFYPIQTLELKNIRKHIILISVKASIIMYYEF